MGRSVSTPPGTVVVAYRDVSHIEDHYEWEEFCEWLRGAALEAWPSFYETSGWAGREDRILAANRLVEFGVSEYCGLAAIWLRVPDSVESPALAETWASLVSRRFQLLFGQYARIGVMSNGEAVYRAL